MSNLTLPNAYGGNKMILVNIHDMLKKCVGQGFSLESISLAAQLPIAELEKMLDDSTYVPAVQNSLLYLHVFLVQLYHVSPLDSDSFLELLNSLTGYFKISHEAIANYLDISIDALNSFISNPMKSSDQRAIELKLMHLFTTFVRDIRFSID